MWIERAFEKGGLFCMKKPKNVEWLQDVIGELDDTFLLETEELRSQKCQERKNDITENDAQTYFQEKQSMQNKKWSWKKFGAIAACVSVFFLGGFVWKQGLLHNYSSDSSQNTNSVIKQMELEIYQNEEDKQAEQADTVLKQDSNVRNQTDSIDILESENLAGTKNLGKEEKELLNEQSIQEPHLSTSVSDVYIAKKEVSLKNTKGVSLDMIGFFIYQGRVYVEYTYLKDANALIGEKAGTATGLIDEWTKKDGYVELAGSVTGDFYKLNGYESEFILCMPMENGDVWVFVNDNDLHLQKGKDILESYLHLSEKSYTAFYMTNEVWNDGRKYEEKKKAVNQQEYERLNEWLADVKEGSMVLTEDIWKDDGIHTFYAEKQYYHLYLEMEDGMLIHLRIFEGGYVMFDGVKDVCVKVEM